MLLFVGSVFKNILEVKYICIENYLWAGPRTYFEEDVCVCGFVFEGGRENRPMEWTG